MALISSLHNGRVKRIRALHSRKERDRTGLFFVEGIRIVIEAIQLHAEVETLVMAPELLTSQLARETVEVQKRTGRPCLEVTAEVFRRISRSIALKYGPQGLGAVVRQRWEALDGLRLGDELCWVALDATQNPGNLGAILRTCDAVGGAGVILLGHATDPYDPAAVRASMGAIFSQRLIRATFEEFAAWKQRHGYVVVGACCDAPVDYRAISYHRPVVLLMGSERLGLSPPQQALCDALVKIPMVGRSDSLNLAVATGVLLYEVFLQQWPTIRADG